MAFDHVLHRFFTCSPYDSQSLYDSSPQYGLSCRSPESYLSKQVGRGAQERHHTVRNLWSPKNSRERVAEHTLHVFFSRISPIPILFWCFPFQSFKVGCQSLLLHNSPLNVPRRVPFSLFFVSPSSSSTSPELPKPYLSILNELNIDIGEFLQAIDIPAFLNEKRETTGSPWILYLTVKPVDRVTVDVNALPCPDDPGLMDVVWGAQNILPSSRGVADFAHSFCNEV